MQEILQTAITLAGTVTPEEESVLSLLCEAAVAQWVPRLRPELTPQDCQEAFIMACAWTALAGFLAGREESSSAVAFSAGNVSIRPLDTKRHEETQILRQQAEAILRPYMQDEAFVFMGVRG